MSSPAEKLTTGRPSEGADRSLQSVGTTLYITHGVVADVADGPTDLFGGRAVPGKPLVDLLDEAEKFGFLPGGTAASIKTALAARQSKQLLSLADGRSIMVATEFAAADDMTLHFVDVSFAVQMTLSQQRDVLTGLPNRVELLRRLNEHLASPASLPQTAVLYVDLDRFKMVNDTLGHPIGDALLKLVVERMQRLLAPKDVLARLGGDEFVILQAEGEQPHAAEVLASRIIEIVGRTYLLQGHSVQVGASVGIALAATDGKTSEELIKNADLALFKAKSAGRGTFRFFTDAMDREIQERRALEIDLRRAIIMQEMSLVYQPQFEIDGNKLVGFESLVRWSTPERGSVSPAQFIPLAEETGIIDQLGEWVLRTACKEAAGWPEPLTVSVNLSPVQFKSPKLVSIIVGALSSAGLPPSRLDLEITEGALIENTEAVLLMLNQIKAMGIKVSIDDFGTGYSSLSYLQKFPFDKIKIDQSFIRSLETNADSAAIVRAVTALGKSLGMMTIAEGVETESQLELIARDGCAQVQGYLTGRPLAADAASELISTRT
ncbi:EAL domain-containing protein [Rhizobium sp. NTR19]|uniref:EAL domain-containing protein n=1 Tax=Neorhizobium turbinariae TaxID=2937795 RepID=A0ABT0IPA9_9HYPH|nr:EAL domain-containing protein [Neorhizobium turbinariae]MCK8779705.1 EAL domain-containing protein [Neorhizobium turbinariae]